MNFLLEKKKSSCRMYKRREELEELLSLSLCSYRFSRVGCVILHFGFSQEDSSKKVLPFILNDVTYKTFSYNS